ncbi:MAG: hypothetical protein AAF797_07050 [Planctomycetota bacterium]
MLATLDDLKDALGFTGTADDAELTSTLAAASAAAERIAGRPLTRAAGVIEYPRAYGPIGDKLVYLDRYPVESVSLVRRRWTLDDAWETLSDGEDYVAMMGNGKLLTQSIRWPSGHRLIEATLTGGYADPASPAPDGASYPPADLQRGVIDTAVAFWNTKADKGLKSVQVGDGDGQQLLDIASTATLHAAATALRRVMA